MMDKEEINILYAMIFIFSLLALLFTSYNFKDLPSLVLIYGLMVITGLSTFHALGATIDSIKCIFKKHTISYKDWDSLTPLLPTIDAQCTRCGYPFILYLDENRKKRAKPMYDDGGF